MTKDLKDFPEEREYRNYICGDCVKRYEGKAYKDKISTHHYGVCDFCKLRNGITNTRNYDWGYAGRPI